MVIHTEPGRDYGVIVPGLPGCYSARDSMDDAFNQAREAFELHLEGLIEDGEVMPKPSNIEVHQDNTEYAGDVWALVDMDLSRLEGRAKRINVIIPERLLTRIDAAAQRSGESRSGFMTHAALESAEREEG